MPINDTCGPLFTASWEPSAQAFNGLWRIRLQARMDGNGSPLYALTWSEVDMPAGVPILRLRAYGDKSRISGNGSSGWPELQRRATRTAHSLAKDASAYGEAFGMSRLSVSLPLRSWRDWPTSNSQLRVAHGLCAGATKGLSVAVLIGWATLATSRDHKERIQQLDEYALNSLGAVSPAKCGVG